MSPATPLLLAALSGWLAYGLPEAALAFAAACLLFDIPFELGPLTLYSSEALLAGLGLGALARHGARGLLRATPRPLLWTGALWLAWLSAHALHPGPPWGGLRAALRAGELLLGLALPLWLGAGSRALSAALLAAVVAGAWGLVQTAAGPGSWLNVGREVEVFRGFQAASAGLGHHNQFGAYMAASLVLALGAAASPRLRQGALAAALVCGAGLAASFSRGAWLGLGLGALAASAVYSKRLAYGLVGLAALLGAAAAASPGSALGQKLRGAIDDPDRRYLLGAALEVWDGKTLWGLGPGAVERLLPGAVSAPGRPEAERSFRSHLHNTYLQWAVEFGLAAALLPLALLAWLAAQAWRARQSAAAWAAALLAMTVAFAFQAGTDLLTLHARGAGLALIWGLALTRIQALAGPAGAGGMNAAPAKISAQEFSFLGARYFLGSLGDAVAWLLSGVRGTVHAANAHTAVMALWDRGLAEARARALTLMPDGRPISLAARLLGVPEAGQVRGPDLMREACLRGRTKGRRHFFYGGGPGVAEAVAQAMRGLAKGLKVAGTESPPFREATDAELKALLARLRRGRVDLLWVGLGAPKQEKLMERLRTLGAPCAMVGVGAAFDYAAGLKREAPAWMQGAGLEWAYRLASEPGRLVLRYLLTNPLFALGALLELLGLWPQRGARIAPLGAERR